MNTYKLKRFKVSYYDNKVKQSCIYLHFIRPILKRTTKEFASCRFQSLFKIDSVKVILINVESENQAINIHLSFQKQTNSDRFRFYSKKIDIQHRSSDYV